MRIVSVLMLLVLPVASGAPPPGFVPSGTQWFPVTSVNYTDPFKLTGTLGAVRMTLLPDGGYFGPFSTVEAGAAGGRFNIGVRLGKHRYLPLWNVSTAVSLLRTWGNPLGDTESAVTGLGVNVSAGIMMFDLSGGAYRILDGGTENGDWLWTVGAGVGI